MYELAIPLLGIKLKDWTVEIKERFAHACSQHHYSQQLKAGATQVLINGQMDEQNVLHTLEYYLALIKKKILIHATTCMTFEDIMLIETHQSQKDKNCDSTHMTLEKSNSYK